MSNITDYIKLVLDCFFAGFPYPGKDNSGEVKILINRNPCEVIVATQDIGHRKDGTPANGCKLMANSAISWWKYMGKNMPILAQLGTHTELAKIAESSDYYRGMHLVKFDKPTNETPLNQSTVEYNTYTVLCAQRDWIKQYFSEVRYVILVTSPYHMWRTYMISLNVFKGTGITPIPTFYQLRQRDYLDRKHQYFSMRFTGAFGEVMYAMREILARLYSVQKEWMRPMK